MNPSIVTAAYIAGQQTKESIVAVNLPFEMCSRPFSSVSSVAKQTNMTTDNEHGLGESGLRLNHCWDFHIAPVSGPCPSVVFRNFTPTRFHNLISHGGELDSASPLRIVSRSFFSWSALVSPEVVCRTSRLGPGRVSTLRIVNP